MFLEGYCDLILKIILNKDFVLYNYRLAWFFSYVSYYFHLLSNFQFNSQLLENVLKLWQYLNPSLPYNTDLILTK